MRKQNHIFSNPLELYDELKQNDLKEYLIVEAAKGVIKENERKKK